MKLISLKIKNFRCYKNEVEIKIDDLTTIIGKNDIGKSTILEALEVFFNNDLVKIDPTDANIHSSDKKVVITCEFEDLPKKIVLDSSLGTTLKDEYLLTKDGKLRITKEYDCSKSAVPVEIFVTANHPTALGFENLLELKEKELQELVSKHTSGTVKKGNPKMRGLIWKSAPDLKIEEVKIALSKSKEDGKKIWEQIESYLPIYALFQSDRNSQDKDKEVQNPMKAAIAAAIAEVQPDIDKIQKKVKEKAEEIAASTHAELMKLDPSLAKKLTPNFVPPTPAKWTGLFGINMDTDDGIALNKRGSGVRRMILVSFFKAEAERRMAKTSKKSVIYALEEPETAQHPNNQKILIDSFKSLASEPACQVLLTTHSPGFASELPGASIRFIDRDSLGEPKIEEGVDVFEDVAKTLGLVPDSRVKLLIFVEGPTDVHALKSLSNALHQADSKVVDLSKDPRIAFVVAGGGNLVHWINENYLKGLGRIQFHLYDNDKTEYAAKAAEVNSRGDGSKAFITTKREIENYLHKDAINLAFSIKVDVVDGLDPSGKSVAKLFGEALAIKNRWTGLKENNAKIKLADHVFPKMTAAMIAIRDPAGEVLGWLEEIKKMIESA
jgi:energy-coupling factor transporter ATP-binding protein EcfA2